MPWLLMAVSRASLPSWSTCDSHCRIEPDGPAVVVVVSGGGVVVVFAGGGVAVVVVAGVSAGGSGTVACGLTPGIDWTSADWKKRVRFTICGTVRCERSGTARKGREHRRKGSDHCL